jgi:uncharacterized protein
MRVKPEQQTALEESALIEALQRAAEPFFENARGSHDWQHTLRVLRLCEHIGAEEGGDMTVLRIAALLHDIGRAAQDNSNGAICHARKGARMAESRISEMPISNQRKENILHCIRSHRFRGEHRPQTLEAKILFDADKLDSIGAVGVARAYLFAGELGACLHSPQTAEDHSEEYSRQDTGYREYRVKLCRVRDRMLTDTGRRMADSRHEFMEGFFRQFLEEYQGER